MAGYIGTKAALLSTTAASVGGDATIGGNLTVDSGDIKLDGNYPVGTGNVALGNTALDSNVSGASNTAIGADALTANTASNNTAVGYQAGYSNTTGDKNTFLGHTTGYNTTTGTFNTYLGYNAGADCTTGSKNTILGRYNGNQGGLDIRTTDNSIVLSDGDGNAPAAFLSGKWYFNTSTSGSGSIPSNYSGHAGIVSTTDIAGNQCFTAVNLATSGTRYFHYFLVGTSQTNVGGITTTGSSTAYNTTSDYRLKENVVAMTGATDRLKQLNPSRFNFIADADTTVDGFLAHEVQAVVPEAITGTKDAVDADGNPVYQGIDQSKLVPLLTAALQEALTKIDALETRITALEAV